MAHGISRLMRAIAKPPAKVLHRTAGLNRERRRWAGNESVTLNEPYRNPARNTGLSRREQLAARRNRGE